jgi:hypothetical protein
MRAARSATALLCTVALAAFAAGCGGSELDYEEVPGPPVEVSIPSGTVESGGNADADAGGDATPTPTATAEPGSTTAPSDQSGSTGTTPSTDTGDTASSDTSGTDSGGATAPAEEDSATNDTAPPAGSEAQQFEDFCAQNPGAC